MPRPDAPFAMFALQVGTDAGETPIESVPVDGAAPSGIAPAEQNTILVIALPLILLVAGALSYLAKRRPASASDGCMTSGERGGLILMGIGALLTGLMFIYLMLAP